MGTPKSPRGECYSNDRAMGTHGLEDDEDHPQARVALLIW